MAATHRAVDTVHMAATPTSHIQHQTHMDMVVKTLVDHMVDSRREEADMEVVSIATQLLRDIKVDRTLVDSHQADMEVDMTATVRHNKAVVMEAGKRLQVMEVNKISVDSEVDRMVETLVASREAIRDIRIAIRELTATVHRSSMAVVVIAAIHIS